MYNQGALVRDLSKQTIRERHSLSLLTIISPGINDLAAVFYIDQHIDAERGKDRIRDIGVNKILVPLLDKLVAIIPSCIITGDDQQHLPVLFKGESFHGILQRLNK